VGPVGAAASAGAVGIDLSVALVSPGLETGLNAVTTSAGAIDTSKTIPQMTKTMASLVGHEVWQIEEYTRNFVSGKFTKIVGNQYAFPIVYLESLA
jgi:hypothetical protein